jgi:hypothetical protein
MEPSVWLGMRGRVAVEELSVLKFLPTAEKTGIPRSWNKIRIRI